MKGVCEAMDAVDFSPEAITEARRGAEEEGLARRIRYRVEDIHAMRLPREAYDIVFFHGSLHHIRNVEGALEQVRDALRPGGLLYVDEYMGPSRSEWTDAMWGFAAQRVRHAAGGAQEPAGARDPLPMDDPSESVRSSAILPACRRLFEILEDRPYGGNVLWFVFPCLDVARVREDSTGALSRLIALEDHLLERGWVESYFRVLVGRRTA
jgi:SAM-dependent methyltransferase